MTLGSVGEWYESLPSVRVSAPQATQDLGGWTADQFSGMSGPDLSGVKDFFSPVSYFMPEVRVRESSAGSSPLAASLAAITRTADKAKAAGEPIGGAGGVVLVVGAILAAWWLLK